MKQFIRTFRQTLLMVAVVLFIACGLGNAQTESEVQNEIKASPTNLIQATQQYKASTQALLTIQESQVREAAAKLEELRILVSEGLVAKSELQENEQTIAALRAQVQATQKQIADADNMIAEIQAEQELAKAPTAKPVRLVSKQYGTFSTTATIPRYNGAMAWSLGGLNEIQTFFAAKFGRSLPTSAVGQSARHNQLGYDHHNAVDVALHPDSAEGTSLINYLQSQGIPFLAFRSAIPGVATGPHIHIGSPSHRL